MKRKQKKTAIAPQKKVSLPPDPAAGRLKELTQILIPIFLIALALKLIFLFSVKENPVVLYPSIDEVEHDRMARAVLQSGLIQKEAFYFAPLYPYLLAAWYALFGFQTFGFKIVQACAGAANVAVVYLLAREIFKDKKTALTAAALTLGYGVYYFYEILLMKETFSVLFFNASLWLFLKSLRTSSKTGCLAAGMVLALSAMLRENILVVIPFILLWLARQVWRKKIPAAALVLWLAGVLFGLMPATVHNWIAAQDFVPVTYQGGTNFYIGNHEGATGVYVPIRPNREVPQYEKFDAVSIAEEESGRTLKPTEVSSFWFSKGLSFIRDHPEEWLKLTAKKFAIFHNNTEIPDTLDYNFFKKLAPFLNLTFVPFGLILALAGAGMVLSFKNRRDYTFLYIVTFTSVFSVVLGFIFARYRLPVVTLYILFAAFGFTGLLELCRKEKWLTVTGLAVMMVGLAVWSNRPIIKTTEVESENNFGMLCLKMGQYDQAIAHFNNILEKYPDAVRVRANISRAWELKGDLKKAIGEKERLIAALHKETSTPLDVRQSEIVTLTMELSGLYQKAGHPDKAQETFAGLIPVYESLIGFYETKSRGAPNQRIGTNIGILCSDLGKIRFNRQEYGLAAPLFEKSLKTDEKNLDTLQNLSVCYYELKKFPEAKAVLQKTLELKPDDAVAHNTMGVIAVTENDRPKAIEHFRAAVEAAPAFLKARLNLGLALSEEGQFEEAAGHLRVMVDAEPENLKARFSLGHAYEKTGRTADAVRQYEEILKIDPENTAAKKRMEQVGDKSPTSASPKSGK